VAERSNAPVLKAGKVTPRFDSQFSSNHAKNNKTLNKDAAFSAFLVGILWEVFPGVGNRKGR